MTDQTNGDGETAVPTGDSEFASLDQLQNKDNFDFGDRTVELKELDPDNPPKLLLKGISVAERHSLTKQLPDDPENWAHKHTALSLSKYVAKPEATADEWVETIKPWPSTALDRVNRKMRELINVGVREETAAAVEFREP